jgi:predicted AlkP superfamily pyrophosphatase or phosphodiesterase
MNNMFKTHLSALIFLLGLFASNLANANIQLVLQITVDGLRGDLLQRYGDRFGEDGFRYLLDQGIVFSNANYQHANTETIVGHTTLATGTSPWEHGMIGNAWFDKQRGELVYNIEDSNHSVLPTQEPAGEVSQLDPSQSLTVVSGRSPKNILATTFGDELKVKTAGQAKVYGLSGKDRGAVAMAGHSGKAFWYSIDNGDFVTSTYYYDSYPPWVKTWNGKKKAVGYANTDWALLNPESSYLLAAQDDRPYEADLKGYGRTFPHSFGSADNALFTTRLLVSPVGDRLLADFAKTLIEAEQLGKDQTPDYLSISFSGVDAVNHFFGPSSLENEDQILQLDRTLANLLNYIESTIGLNNTLIVFAADHGMAEMPEYMTELGIPASRIVSKDMVQQLNDLAKTEYEIENIVHYFYRPYVYLDEEKITRAGLKVKAVESKLAKWAQDIEGISLAVSTRKMSKQQTSPVLQRIRRNNHRQRSGNIYVVQERYWYLFEGGSVAVMHGSPWKYDTHVPIIFAGAGLKPNRVHRPVHPADVAPTLAVLLGTKFPSAADGQPLPEVLGSSINAINKVRLIKGARLD